MNETTCQSLDAFLDDELDTSHLDAFQEHITICDPCAIAIAQQSKLDDSLRAYAECIVPNDRKQVTLPIEPSPSNHKRYAFFLVEACAVAAIAYGIWFSLDRMASDQQVAEEASQQVAAPPEEQAEAKEVQSRRIEKRLNEEQELFSEDRRQMLVEIEQAKSIAKAGQERAAASDANKGSEDNDPDAENASQGESSTVDAMDVDKSLQQLMELAQKRGDLYEELRRTEIQLQKIETISQSGKDSMAALVVITQVLNRETDLGLLPDSSRREVPKLDVDKKLAPLMIERNQVAAAYGRNHPNVKNLDAQLGQMKKALKHQAARIGQAGGPANESLEKLATYLNKQLIPLTIERNQVAAAYGRNHPNARQLDAQLKAMKVELKRLVKESLSSEPTTSQETKGFRGDLIAILVRRETLKAEYGAGHPVAKQAGLLVEQAKLSVKTQVRQPEDAIKTIEYLTNERQKYVGEHGVNDRTFRKIDAELAALKNELKKQFSKMASDSVAAIIDAEKEKVHLTKSQIVEVESRIKSMRAASSQAKDGK